MNLLSDGEKHSANELSHIPFNKTIVSGVVSDMIEKELIHSDSIFIWLAQKR